MQSQLHSNYVCASSRKLAIQSMAERMVGRWCDVNCVKHTICVGGYQDGEVGI